MAVSRLLNSGSFSSDAADVATSPDTTPSPSGAPVFPGSGPVSSGSTLPGTGCSLRSAFPSGSTFAAGRGCSSGPVLADSSDSRWSSSAPDSSSVPRLSSLCSGQTCSGCPVCAPLVRPVLVPRGPRPVLPLHRADGLPRVFPSSSGACPAEATCVVELPAHSNTTMEWVGIIKSSIGLLRLSRDTGERPFPLDRPHSVPGHVVVGDQRFTISWD